VAAGSRAASPRPGEQAGRGDRGSMFPRSGCALDDLSCCSFGLVKCSAVELGGRPSANSWLTPWAVAKQPRARPPLSPRLFSFTTFPRPKGLTRIFFAGPVRRPPPDGIADASSSLPPPVIGNRGVSISCREPLDRAAHRGVGRVGGSGVSMGFPASACPQRRKKRAPPTPALANQPVVALSKTALNFANLARATRRSAAHRPRPRACSTRCGSSPPGSSPPSPPRSLTRPRQTAP